MPSRITCAAKLHLLAVDGEILFDLDDEVGIASRTRSPVVGPNMSAIDGTFDFLPT